MKCKLLSLITVALISTAAHGQATQAPIVDAYGNVIIGQGATISPPTDPNSPNTVFTGQISIGTDAHTDGQDAMAQGTRASATQLDAMARGRDSTATGIAADADGVEAEATAAFTVAKGFQSKATAEGGTATGANSNVSGVRGTATGIQSNASAMNTTANGASSSASGFAASGFGANSNANADQSTSLGYFTSSNALGCVALGSQSVCNDAYTLSVGNSGLNLVRRISNVGMGTSNSDAATMDQLRQMANGIGGGAGFNSFGYFTPPEINFLTGATYSNTVDGLLDLDQRVWDLEQNPGGGTGTPGPQGPDGRPGLDGVNGRSAYEVAVSNGFQGDEQSWLASLKGADGRDGVGGSNVVAGKNIEVVDNEDGTQSVSLSDNVELSAQGKLAIGATTVNNDGVSIQGGPSMTANGIDAGGRQITGVAPGTIAQGSMDAVNGGQLWDLENRLNDRWSDTNRRIDGLGAQLGAMSNMAMAAAANPAAVGEVQFNAGLGFSGNQAALAVGLSARLSPRVAISGGLSMGGGNKVVGGMGLSINLGR